MQEVIFFLQKKEVLHCQLLGVLGANLGTGASSRDGELHSVLEQLMP